MHLMMGAIAAGRLLPLLGFATKDSSTPDWKIGTNIFFNFCSFTGNGTGSNL
jgi:hypothetical protein